MRSASLQSRGPSATMSPGRLQRQRDASASRGHAGNRVCGFETLGCDDDCESGGSGSQKVRRRRFRRCRGFASAGLWPGGTQLRLGPEQSAEGFGRSVLPTRSMGESPESERSPGSIGRASSGNAAGEQRTSGREIPEVEATSGERESFGDRAGQKRANYEREWSFGERASNGSVTVSTWSGGESSEGSCACGKCRMSAETSAVGTQPGEPQGR
jgi:hypothetical protein